MMRNEYQTSKMALVLCTATLIFAFVVFSPVSVQADEYEPTVIPTPSPIEYKLPYPGLLPDNPLYFLKSIRDNMMGFFIGKPLDKAKFDLLESDKKVSASYLLVTQENGKTELAEATFSQAQDFFQDAIKQTITAHKQGMNTTDLANKLSEANKKHFQVLHEIQQQVNASNNQKFQDEQNRADNLAKQVKSLQTK